MGVQGGVTDYGMANNSEEEDSEDEDVTNNKNQ